MAAAEQQRLQAFTRQLTLMAATLRQEWQQAGAQTLGQQQAICDTLAQTARDIHTQAQAHTTHTLAEISGLVNTAAEAPRAAAAVIAELQQVARDTVQLHTRMADTVQAQLDGLSAQFGRTATAVTDTLAATEQERLQVFTQQLEGMATGLRQAWQQASAQTLGQQQAICQTLEQTARDIHTQAQAQASQTITEVAGLMQTAAEAPRVAAEVMGQLRQQLSDSMARDNTLLDERSRIMGTLGSLLDTINLAATEQRGAIDALVASSAELMQRASTQFSAQIEAESGKLGQCGRTDHRQRGGGGQPGRGLWPGRAAVQRLEPRHAEPAAAHRGRAGQVGDAQRRAAGLLRGAGARGDRPEHLLAAPDR